jgi:hypothetical protein
MYLPKQSRPAMRGGRRRPILSSYPHLPGVFPLQEAEEDEEAEPDESGDSNESAESGEY